MGAGAFQRLNQTTTVSKHLLFVLQVSFEIIFLMALILLLETNYSDKLSIYMLIVKIFDYFMHVR